MFNAGFGGGLGAQMEESDIEDDEPINVKNGMTLMQIAMSNSDSEL